MEQDKREVREEGGARVAMEVRIQPLLKVKLCFSLVNFFLVLKMNVMTFSVVISSSGVHFLWRKDLKFGKRIYLCRHILC